jgi:hypothetical protein
VQHFSQKDSHESVECFLLADAEDQVYDWVDKKEFGTYSDKNNEDGKTEIYDDDFNVIGLESFKEKMLRVGGQFFDDDYEPCDTYYGATIYGWEISKEDATQSDIELLELLSVLEKYSVD